MFNKMSSQVNFASNTFFLSLMLYGELVWPIVFSTYKICSYGARITVINLIATLIFGTLCSTKRRRGNDMNEKKVFCPHWYPQGWIPMFIRLKAVMGSFR